MTTGPGSQDSNPQKAVHGKLPEIAQDRYEVLELLGAGGMGMVLKARHKQLNKLVAIKVLNTSLSLDETSIKRFDIEAKAGSQLSHPNLIAVFDYGLTEDKQPFLVMEYVVGESLQEILEKESQLSKERFLHVFEQVVKALQYIHKQNIIHRDIKTSNIMLHEIEGEFYAKLLDFGIAKVLVDSGLTVQDLTATGSVFGSPLYMSPEQCKGKKSDQRSDIYSLGCVMYECFTSMPPVIGENALDTIYKHVNDPAVTVENKEDLDKISQRIALMIEKCLAKEVEQRFQSTAELLAEIKDINQDFLAQKFQQSDTGQSAGVSATANIGDGNKVQKNRWTKAPAQGQETLAPEIQAQSNQAPNLEPENAAVPPVEPPRALTPEKPLTDRERELKSLTSKNLRGQIAQDESARDSKKPNKIILYAGVAVLVVGIGAAAVVGAPFIDNHFKQQELEKMVGDAEAAFKSGQAQKALPLYKQLLTQAKERKDSLAVAHLKTRLGQIYLVQGKVSMASDNFTAALEILKDKKEGAADNIGALLGLAECNIKKENSEEAETYLDRARKVAAELNAGPKVLGDILRASAANAASGKGDLKQAVNYLDHALKEYSKASDFSAQQKASIWLDSAELCLKLKWTDEMLRRVDNALALVPEISSDNAKAEIERRANPMKALAKKQVVPTPVAPAVTQTATSAPSAATSSAPATASRNAMSEAEMIKMDNEMKAMKLEQLKRAEALNEKIRKMQMKSSKAIDQMMKNHGKRATPVSDWNKTNKKGYF